MEFIKEIFLKYGDTIGYIVSGLIGLGAIVVWGSKFIPEFIWSQLDRVKAKEKLEHNIASKYRKSLLPIIKEKLKNLAEEVEADRVLLFEYSNGVTNLVGLPFLYATATNEVVKYNVSQVSKQYQKINVSLFGDFIQELEEETYFYFKNIKDIKETYPLLFGNMCKNGVKSGLFYSLYGDSDTIGFLVVTTVTKEFERHDVLPELATTAQSISSLLNFDKIKSKIK